jgi:hypothetical protein
MFMLFWTGCSFSGIGSMMMLHHLYTIGDATTTSSQQFPMEQGHVVACQIMSLQKQLATTCNDIPK